MLIRDLIDVLAEADEDYRAESRDARDRDALADVGALVWDWEARG